MAFDYREHMREFHKTNLEYSREYHRNYMKAYRKANPEYRKLENVKTAKRRKGMTGPIRLIVRFQDKCRRAGVKVSRREAAKLLGIEKWL